MKTIVKLVFLFFVINSVLSCSKDDAIAQEEKEEVNEAPVISAQTYIAAENIADNLPIGTVRASDPEGEVLSYSISANDDNLFEINNEGVLSLDDLQVLDFETAESHTITVAVSDGTNTTEALVIIIVTDIDDTSFVTTWQTTTTGETVIILTRADEFSYDYTIDWGDGTIQTGVTGDANHPYDSPGTYTVSISGTFPAINFADNTTSQEQLRSVERWGNIQWQTMESAFQSVNALTINAIDSPDLSQVKNMHRMFHSTNLTGNINNWTVSNINNMSSMFQFSSFNQDISDWNVSSVTNMSLMFQDSSFNKDISTWEVGNVTNMIAMFQGSSFNKDINSWNVANVTDMSFMFSGSSFSQDISDWNVANVANMLEMFSNSQFNQDLSDWTVSNVSNMLGMFFNAPFNQDISGWNVANVTSCESFALNAPLTVANTPNFTNCTP